MMKKRALDLFLTIVGAIAWVPAVTIGAALVLLSTGRPIFYSSMRRVAPGETIRLVKFRTMVKNAAELVNRGTVPIDNNVRFLNIPPDSPLYTKVGRLLERCSITELPQFVHVLRGQMSVVGNRPLPENVIACLREEYPYAENRFLTKAGLTGPAQLVGRMSLTDDERLTLESAYCRACLHSYSIWLDLSILVNTVLIVTHLRPSFTYNGVLDLIERRTTRRTYAPISIRPVLRPAEVLAVEAELGSRPDELTA